MGMGMANQSSTHPSGSNSTISHERPGHVAGTGPRRMDEPPIHPLRIRYESKKPFHTWCKDFETDHRVSNRKVPRTTSRATQPMTWKGIRYMHVTNARLEPRSKDRESHDRKATRDARLWRRQTTPNRIPKYPRRCRREWIRIQPWQMVPLQYEDDYPMNDSSPFPDGEVQAPFPKQSTGWRTSGSKRIQSHCHLPCVKEVATKSFEG